MLVLLWGCYFFFFFFVGGCWGVCGGGVMGGF